MTGAGRLGSSRSLVKQVNALETRLIRRRHRMQTVVTGIRHKIAASMVSSASLLTAAGIGVAIEQTGRHQGWSLAVALNTAVAGIRLFLLAISPPVDKSSEITGKKPAHELTNR